MPIDGINQNGRAGPFLVSGARSYLASGTNGRSDLPQSPDDLQISDRTQELLRVRKLVDAQPDVRLDRVNRLAKSIDEGTYDVRGEQIAEAIIEKHLIDLES